MPSGFNTTVEILPEDIKQLAAAIKNQETQPIVKRYAIALLLSVRNPNSRAVGAQLDTTEATANKAKASYREKGIYGILDLNTNNEGLRLRSTKEKQEMRERIRKTIQDGPVRLNYWTKEEAAQRLGITKFVFLRWLRLLKIHFPKRPNGAGKNPIVLAIGALKKSGGQITIEALAKESGKHRASVSYFLKRHYPQWKTHGNRNYVSLLRERIANNDPALVNPTAATISSITGCTRKYAYELMRQIGIPAFHRYATARQRFAELEAAHHPILNNPVAPKVAKLIGTTETIARKILRGKGLRGKPVPHGPHQQTVAARWRLTDLVAQDRDGLSWLTVEEIASKIGCSPPMAKRLLRETKVTLLSKGAKLASHIRSLIKTPPPPGYTKWTYDLLNRHFDTKSARYVCQHYTNKSKRLSRRQIKYSSFAAEIRRLIATPPPSGHRKWKYALLNRHFGTKNAAAVCKQFRIRLVRWPKSVANIEQGQSGTARIDQQ